VFFKKLFERCPSLAPPSRVTQLVDAIVQRSYRPIWKPDLSTSPEAGEVLAGDPDLQMTVVIEALHRMELRRWEQIWVLAELSRRLLRKHLPWTEERLVLLLAAVASAVPIHSRQLPLAEILGTLERWTRHQPLSRGLRELVSSLRGLLQMQATNKSMRALVDRLGSLLGGEGPVLLDGDEPWTRATLAHLDAAPDSMAWKALLQHAASGTSARPSKRWLAQAGQLIAATGEPPFKSAVMTWFPLVAPREPHSPRLPDKSAAVLRGLVWCCALFEDGELSRVVADLALVCLRKIPNWGPISASVGNACIFTLGAMRGTEAVAQLGRVQAKVKYVVARRMSDRALDDAAERAGMAREDLEDLAVPDFGLNAAGERSVEVGAATATLRIAEEASLEWSKEGRPVRTVPAEAKRDHPEQVRELRRAVKDIEQMLVAQRTRLERLFLTGRSWPLAAFRARLLDHPLLQHLARRLIWNFQSSDGVRTAIWLDGGFSGADGEGVEISDSATVSLWHPLGSDIGTVRAWRKLLVDRSIVQPFKQAHREIYLLTDAELATATYSNRFAAHILRQHQMAALCRERAWIYRLQGGFDGANAPTLELPSQALRIEFFVEPVDDGANGPSGISLHLATDQVRFSDSQGVRELASLPPLVFSEVMRDVDLFVGVCSIGNDPQWSDRGEGRHTVYWNAYAFGDLSGSAPSRRALLEELLPKLNIAPVCKLESKFLVVSGQLRSYRIHLGSGNILMEPNDQYLCIVPNRAGSTKIRLPFQGDSTLSVILSKAFLLAKDSQIKDETILRQIRGRSAN
jgi:hypothetical protein